MFMLPGVRKSTVTSIPEVVPSRKMANDCRVAMEWPLLVAHP